MRCDFDGKGRRGVRPIGWLFGVKASALPIGILAAYGPKDLFRTDSMVPLAGVLWHSGLPKNKKCVQNENDQEVRTG